MARYIDADKLNLDEEVELADDCNSEKDTAFCPHCGSEMENGEWK